MVCALTDFGCPNRNRCAAEILLWVREKKNRIQVRLIELEIFCDGLSPWIPLMDFSAANLFCFKMNLFISLELNSTFKCSFFFHLASSIIRLFRRRLCNLWGVHLFVLVHNIIIVSSQQTYVYIYRQPKMERNTLFPCCRFGNRTKCASERESWRVKWITDLISSYLWIAYTDH